jgi:hypothetical protein
VRASRERVSDWISKKDEEGNEQGKGQERQTEQGPGDVTEAEVSAEDLDEVDDGQGDEKICEDDGAEGAAISTEWVGKVRDADGRGFVHGEGG